MGVSGQRYAPAALLLGKRLDTRCRGRWVGPRAGLDGARKISHPSGFGPRTVHPLGSRHPGPQENKIHTSIFHSTWSLGTVVYKKRYTKLEWSRYRPGVAQRVGRRIEGIEGVSGQQHAPAALYPRERPGTHFTGGWVGHRADLDGRKISSPSGFDPGPSIP